MEKSDGSWGLTVNYSKISQIVALIAVAALNVIALLDRLR